MNKPIIETWADSAGNYAVLDNGTRFYLHESEWPECMTLYERTPRDSELYATMPDNMVWSKAITDLTPRERDIYNRLKRAVEKEIGGIA